MIHTLSPAESGQSIKQDDILAFHFDVEAFAKGVPKSASTRAHFINQNQETLKKLNPAALDGFQRRYPKKLAAFSDFPIGESVLRFSEVAGLAFPNDPPAEALRKVSRMIYQQVLGTMLGRAIFAALRNELMSIFRNGPRAFELFEKNGTRVIFTKLGPTHFRYDFIPSYSLIEISQVGIIEGAAMFCGVQTEIFVKRRDLYNGSLECKW